MNTNNTFNRRSFLKSGASGLLASQSLLASSLSEGSRNVNNPGGTQAPHFQPKAKRVIFLHMAGGPSHLEMFDYKPVLKKFDGKACPQELLEGKKLAFSKGVPTMLGPQADFKQYGQDGTWVSERLPHFSKIVDEVTMIKSMTTSQFNHAPAQILMHTGYQLLGRPSLGSWLSYGLGSENNNMPGFVVLNSGGKNPSAGKSVWGSGFLPSIYQGVQCRSTGEPVLFSKNPKMIDAQLRQKTIGSINRLNKIQYNKHHDPETLTRIAQYKMANRMQTEAPHVMNLNLEPQYIRDLYGAVPGQASFANNCLLARRMIENDVRFVQLYDWGWDSHGTAPSTDLHQGFADKCRDIDRPVYALLNDLKARGLLEDTLVVWGGEFGRTPFRENRGGKYGKYVGRDHSPNAFTMWMAGAGVKKGFNYGESDDTGYNAAIDPVEVHDLQATILHLMGFDHERLTYPFQGRDFRLTDVFGRVLHKVLA
ncbi:DUF1501 domain-containing protein [Lentisphaera profundi]|uniref:DUF1501 domain-containing protein n=1 Tax=Lentisphaera profundi TaxID=1658616 RepID=A0ABY7VZ98_9BACT|nr:DUF1501 domain-containing protein [Lentisphaera profundi]WDE99037.1 DUF1501 domain-containing protein [Lentisphaera profundi]